MGWISRKFRAGNVLSKTLILLFVASLIPLAIAAAAVVRQDDFDPDIDGSQWAEMQGVRASTVCNDQDEGAIPRDHNALVFWGTDESPGERYIVTTPIDARGGGTVSFELRYGDEQNGAAEWCDSTSEGDELVFQYNIGAGWVTINSYNAGTSQGYRGDNFAPVNETIPGEAMVNGVQFRWYQGPNVADNVGRNTAAIDNVVIDVVPFEEQTPEPTEEPTVEPTGQPTGEPTEEPTGEPTEEPTEEPGVLTPTPTVVPVVPKVIAKLNDGSMNAYHLGRPIAIYDDGERYVIYGIDINTGWGSMALVLTDAEIEAVTPGDAPILLASAENPYNFRTIDVYLMPDGSIQVNTMYWDGKEYIVSWDPANNELSALDW